MSKQKFLPFAVVALIPLSSSSYCVALAVFTYLGLAILAKCTTGFVFYQNGNWNCTRPWPIFSPRSRGLV